MALQSAIVPGFARSSLQLFTLVAGFDVPPHVTVNPDSSGLPLLKLMKFMMYDRFEPAATLVYDAGEIMHVGGIPERSTVTSREQVAVSPSAFFSNAVALNGGISGSDGLEAEYFTHLNVHVPDFALHSVASFDIIAESPQVVTVSNGSTFE